MKTKTTVPKLSDFSERATKKATLSEILQHPLTLYPSAVGFLGALSFVVIEPTIFAAVAAAGGLALGAGSLLTNYVFRRETFTKRHMEKLHRALAEHKQELIKNLEQDLLELKSLDGFEKYAEQGADQFNKIKKKYSNLNLILREKLNIGELTFSRYLGTAEQVYLSVLDNLLSAVSILKSVSTIDTNYIDNRFKVLDELNDPSEADLQEIETLRKRLHLREKQLETVNMLLTNNEVAMTEMDNTAAAVSQMKTARGQASTDFDTAMKDLEELARRADDYSI